MSKEGVKQFEFVAENGLVKVRNFHYGTNANRKEPAARYSQLATWQLGIYSADSKPCVGTITNESGVLDLRLNQMLVGMSISILMVTL